MDNQKINPNKIATILSSAVVLNKFLNNLNVKFEVFTKIEKNWQKDINTANKTISKLTEENKSLKDYKGWYEAKCKETLSNSSLLDILLEPYKRILLFIKKQKWNQLKGN